MSASDTSHIPMLMTEGQGYLDTYVCCQEPHQDVDQWCFTFKQYEIDNADNDQCQKTNGWTQRLNSIWSHCLYLCCQDHHAVIKWIMLIAAHGCDEHGNWVMFDVQAELAELQRKLDLLWTSELLNTTFKTIYSTSTFLNSTTKLFSNIVILSFNSASCVPDVISAFTQILQCYLWTFHAQKCSSMWFPVMPK